MLPTNIVRNIAGLPVVGPRLLVRAHRRGWGFDVVSWPEFADAVSAQRPDAVTVDVFETCIVRDLAGDHPIEAVIDWRTSQANVNERDRWEKRTAIAAATELEMCGPVDGAAEALAAIRSVVGRIIFVSDTERSSALLEQILRGFGHFVDGDRLVVSCEQGATKSDGLLFDQISSQESGVVWHAGNSEWSDGAMAAAHGFRPFEIGVGNLTRYEEAMIRRPTTFGPALAAASRSVRMQLGAEKSAGSIDERRFQLQMLGAQVAGPAMASFVLWIAEQCQTHDIGHLSFLARDGDLPMQVAQAMSADHLGALPTSYLHCNRLIVTLASASAVGVEQWLADGTATADAFLEVNRHVIPFSRLLDRIGFEVGDVGDVVGRDHRLAQLQPNQVLPSGAVDEWHELLAHPGTAQLITNRSVVRRELLLDHLRSQGIGKQRLAMVDVGWRGRLAWLLSAVLRDFLDHEPVHLHFGGDKVISGLADGVKIERFAFDGLTVHAPLLSPVSTVETITASGKPRVIDYGRNAAGEVELVLDNAARASNADGHDHLADVWRGAIRMAALIPSSSSLRERGLDPTSLDSEVRNLLRLWWNAPTTVEAEALKPLEFEHDEAGSALRPVVAPYHLSDLLGDRQARQWIQGSIAVSSPLSRAGVRLIHQLRRLRA